jgi:hypothetical protein
VIALVVLWRRRYKLTLRDLAEMFLIRGVAFSYEAVREWEAKLTPALAENLRGGPLPESAPAGECQGKVRFQAWHGFVLIAAVCHRAALMQAAA